MPKFLTTYVYLVDAPEAKGDSGQAEYDARTEIAHFDTRMAARTKELKHIWQWALRVGDTRAKDLREVSQ